MRSFQESELKRKKLCRYHDLGDRSGFLEPPECEWELWDSYMERLGLHFLISRLICWCKCVDQETTWFTYIIYPCKRRYYKIIQGETLFKVKWGALRPFTNENCLPPCLIGKCHSLLNRFNYTWSTRETIPMVIAILINWNVCWIFDMVEWNEGKCCR